MRNRMRLLAVLAVLALVLVACGDEETPATGGGGGDSITVTAEDFSFSETEIQVDPGATVDLTLDNTGDAKHSFTSDDLDVEIEAEGGEEASTTFDAPDSGTFEFHCEYHPDAMTGQIVVGEGGASDTGGSGGGGPAEDDTDY